ncbi:MAG: hypothetical protein R3F34_06735 [Planctomycetota bacterium]
MAAGDLLVPCVPWTSSPAPCGAARSGAVRREQRLPLAQSPFATDWRPRDGAAVVVTSPSDVFRRRDEPEPTVEIEPAPRREREADAPAPPPTVVQGVDPDEHRKVRERVAFLEGALEASARVESAAQTFADRLEDRARSERKQYERDLASLRLQLEQRERELRTLALEMGKVQGRLEVAESKLLAASSEPSRRESARRDDGVRDDRVRDEMARDDDRGLPRRTDGTRRKGLIERLRDAITG